MKKQNTGKVIAVILAAIIVLSVFPITAFAASYTVYRENIVSGIIEVNNGSWKPMEVREYRTDDGNVAYCIQHNRSGPGTGGSGYDEMNPFDQLSEYQRNGLFAILLHGYPWSNGGIGDEAGRYVTGLAVRCWLTETGDPQHTYYSYLDRVNYPEKMRDGSVGGAVDFLDSLLDYARDQDIMSSSISASTLSFARSTSEPQYYVGSMTITGENVTSWSGIFNGLPVGAVVEGNDGVIGGTVTIKIPVSAGNASISIDLTGYSNKTAGHIFFLSPSGGGLQNIITPDPNYSAAATSTSAGAKMPVGNLTINKKDADTGAGVANAVFNVSFAGALQTFTDNGGGVYTFNGSGGTTEIKTPASGTISILNLPAGNYQTTEKTPPSGYVGAAAQNATVTDGGTASQTFTNTPTKVVLTKKDKSNGAMVPGAKIRLFKADGTTKIGDYVTDVNGAITVKYLPAGATYKWQEIEVPPGYTLDPTVYSFTIAANGAVTGSTAFQNDITQIVFTKKDAKTGEGLDGLEFKIMRIAETEPTATPEPSPSASGTPDQEVKGEYIKFTYDDGRHAYGPDPNGSETFTTDESMAVIERLPKGNYRLEEVQPYDNYVQHDPIDFTVDDSTTATDPLLLEMENESTRVIMEKVDGLTKEMLDGCVFQIIYDEPIEQSPEPTTTAEPLPSISPEPTAPATTEPTVSAEPSPSASETDAADEPVEQGAVMPLTWDEDSGTYEYDPENGEADFSTHEGTATIDYLPKGKYKIVEVEYDTDKYLPPAELPFELDESTAFLTPLELTFENWTDYSTIRVIHRRWITKEQLADPYMMTCPLGDEYSINPDNTVLKNLPLRMVEVYKTDRHLDVNRFPDEGIGKENTINESLPTPDLNYTDPTDKEFTERIEADAERRDERAAWFSTQDFNVKGTYDNEITTIIYWYEDKDVPLVVNDKPVLDNTIISDGGEPATPPKTGDSRSLTPFIIIGAAAGCTIAIVIYLRKRKKRK